MTIRFDDTGAVHIVPGTPPAEAAFDIAAHEYKLAREAFSRSKSAKNRARYIAADEAFEIALAASKAERYQINRVARMADWQASATCNRWKAEAARNTDQKVFSF